jgi:hypothetical protein
LNPRPPGCSTEGVAPLNTAPPDPSEVSLARYKNFSRIYYKTVRAAKKLHYSCLLASNAKNVKKTWNIFNELLGKNKSNDSVEKINVEGRTITDPAEIASEFNGFFYKHRQKNFELNTPHH